MGQRVVPLLGAGVHSCGHQADDHVGDADGTCQAFDLSRTLVCDFHRQSALIARHKARYTQAAGKRDGVNHRISKGEFGRHREEQLTGATGEFVLITACRRRYRHPELRRTRMIVQMPTFFVQPDLGTQFRKLAGDLVLADTLNTLKISLSLSVRLANSLSMPEMRAFITPKPTIITPMPTPDSARLAMPRLLSVAMLEATLPSFISSASTLFSTRLTPRRIASFWATAADLTATSANAATERPQDRPPLSQSRMFYRSPSSFRAEVRSCRFPEGVNEFFLRGGQRQIGRPSRQHVTYLR